MGILSSIGKGISSAFKGVTSAFSQSSPMLSFGAGLLGDFLQQGQSNKQLEMQVAENEKNRQFNALQAQKNRDFQLEMWNKQNSYNDPKSVISRMMRAGVNPAVALGGGFADAAQAPSGSTASHSGSVGTGLPSYTGLQSFGPQFAQIENIQADSELKRTQAAINRAELPWIDRLRSLQERNGIVDAGLKEFDLNNLKPQELTNLVKLGEELDNKIDVLKEQKRLTSEQADIAAKDNRVRDLLNTATIRKLFADTDFTISQQIRLLTLLPAELSKLRSEVRFNNAKAALDEFEQSLNKAAEQEFGITRLSGEKRGQVSGGLRVFGHNMGNFLKDLVSPDTYESLSAVWHGVIDVVDMVGDLGNVIK